MMVGDQCAFYEERIGISLPGWELNGSDASFTHKKWQMNVLHRLGMCPLASHTQPFPII